MSFSVKPEKDPLERIADLEKSVRALTEGTIDIARLPVKKLLDKMLSEWQPSGSELLLPSSVSESVLADNAVSESKQGRWQGVQATRGAVLGVANNTPNVLVTLPTDVYDPDDLHDTGANTERLAITKPGWYLAVGTVFWAANAVGTREINIATSSGFIIGGASQPAVATAGVQTEQVCIGLVAIGTLPDYVNIRSFQNSGAALNITYALLSLAKIGGI